jgi:membrane protein required for colicin V production
VNLELTALDWVFAAVLALSLLLGVLRGLVSEVLSLISWVAAFFLAQYMAPQVSGLLPLGKAPEPLRYAAGFLLVFLIVVILGAFIAWLIGKMVQAVGLRPIDRILGGAFGLARGVIVLLAFSVVVNLSPLRELAWWTDSRAAGMAMSALKKLKPVLPSRFGQYLPP